MPSRPGGIRVSSPYCADVHTSRVAGVGFRAGTVLCLPWRARCSGLRPQCCFWFFMGFATLNYRVVEGSQEPTWHAFISYVHEDTDRVEQLHQELQKAGIPVWRDRADLWPGQDWRAEIRRAITDNALVFIACFSTNSNAREKSYQREEVNLAIEQLRLRSPDVPWFIPVRFNECDIPDQEIGGGRTLSWLHRVDLFDDGSSAGTQRLVATVQNIIKRRLPGRRPTNPARPDVGSQHIAGTSSGRDTPAVVQSPIAANRWRPEADQKPREHAEGAAGAQRIPSAPSVSPAKEVKLPTAREPKLLIAEAERVWCDIYKRVAQSCGLQDIKVARSLPEAEALINEMQFGEALVAVCLSSNDNSNADGLRVIEKIRSVGDRTSIIAITGRQGRDVLTMTRDAIRKYGAYDTVSKQSLNPQDLREVLTQGLTAYEEGLSAAAARAPEILRGNQDRLTWEDKILRTIPINGGSRELDQFLVELCGKYLPVMPRSIDGALEVNAELGVALGIYWSRALGQAVMVCLGAIPAIDSLSAEAAPKQFRIDGYRIREILEERVQHSAKGIVVTLNDMQRENFSS
jgi:ActR/RegA family two-component response regulator